VILWAPAPSRKRRPCGVCRPRRAAVRTGRVCMAKCGGRFVDTCMGKTWKNYEKLYQMGFELWRCSKFSKSLHWFTPASVFSRFQISKDLPSGNALHLCHVSCHRGWLPRLPRLPRPLGHPPWSCARLPWLWAWEPPSGCNAGDGDGALGAQRHVWSLGNLGTHSSRLLPIFSSGDISPHSFFTQVLVSTCVHICPTLKHAEL
jgi:hypothetical protein